MDTLPGSESLWLRDPSGSTKVSGYCENCSICLSRENFYFGSGLSRERAGLRGRKDGPIPDHLTGILHSPQEEPWGTPPVPRPCQGTWLCPGP